MHRSKLWPPSELEGCWACRTQTQWEGRRKPSRENHPVCQTWFFFHKKNNKKLPNLNLKISIWEFTENVSYVNTASPCSHGSSGAAAEKPIWFSREIPQRMRRECIFFFTENLPQGGKKKSQQPEKASWKCEQLGQFLRKHGWCWQEMLGGMQDWLHILPWSRTEQRDQCEKPLLGSTFPFDFG